MSWYQFENGILDQYLLVHMGTPFIRLKDAGDFGTLRPEA